MTLKVMQRWRVRARCQCRGDGASSPWALRGVWCEIRNAFSRPEGTLALPELDGNTRSRFRRFSLRHASSLPSADELGGIRYLARSDLHLFTLSGRYRGTAAATGAS